MAGEVRLSDAEIDRLLDDDLRFGDLTTRSLKIGDAKGRMTFAARQDLVVSGTEEARRMLEKLGARVSFMAGTGSVMASGDLVLRAEGSVAALHAGWKLAQTFVEWASGVATLTRDIVAAARARSPRITVLCTRKSIPFTRQIALKSVIAGGGEVHRLGLSDTILLFPEHRLFLDCDIAAAIARLKERVPERSIMIEVNSESDALAAAEAKADVIQLEKFAPSAVRRVVDEIRKREDRRPIIAAAGGINAKNAGEYAGAGADTLVTSAPFYAPPTDIQVQMTPM